MFQSPRTACIAAGRCDLACPSFCMLITVAVASIGYMNWNQGYFIQPNEGKGGCQGEDAGFGEKEAEWRSAWTGDCAFLYRNEVDDDSGSRRPGQAIHGEEYDACYREACRAYCQEHMCQAKVIAIALWIVAFISGCIAVGCIGMSCHKVADAMRLPEEQEETQA